MSVVLAKNIQKKVIIILILITTILCAYWQVQNFEFVSYDDPKYITENYAIQSGITWQSFAATFTDLHASNWYPLTLLSHGLDWQLFGRKAGGHHWSNVIIHIVNTILLFLLLSQLTGAIWRSALVAALFAIHPINVESVAWVAERKNVLSTFFWIVTMLFYVRYVKAPDWKRYLPVLISFALGLMSKPMLVTLPFVLLLMDYWPLNRNSINTEKEIHPAVNGVFSIRKPRPISLILEKVPLLILAVISSGVTFYAAKKGGTLAEFISVPLMQRISNAAVSYVLYLKKLFWPGDLAVFYPYINIPIHQALLAVFLLSAITVIAGIYYKKYPYFIVGWFWYLGTLVPVIGIVQVGSQSMADRYAYVPFIGIFMALSWTIAEMIKTPLLRKIISLVMFSIGISLLLMTWHQLKYWKTSYALFERASYVTGSNAFTHNGMGLELMRQNKIGEAIEHFKEALKKNTDHSGKYMAYVNLGEAYRLQNKKMEAMAAYKQALSLNAKCDFAYHKIGIILIQQGQVGEAIAEYKKAITINKTNPVYHINLGNAYARQGKFEEAVKEYTEVLRIQPDNAGVHNNLAMVLERRGKIDEAVAHLKAAIRLQPEYADAHFNLATILEKGGNTNEADYHYREAKRIVSEYRDRKNESK